jgi:beta-aspartyl-peptidase (threonine type)
MLTGRALKALLAATLLGALAYACFIVRPPLAMAGGAPAQPQRSPTALAEAQLRRLLEEQQSAWNRGDVDAFMQGYWRSEQTTFSGPSGVTRGWDAVLARYHRNYPDRAAMGRLEFSQLEITPLCPDAALILGHWHLDRADKPVGGVFTLVARRFPEGWRIIHDHTDAVDSPSH